LVSLSPQETGAPKPEVRTWPVNGVDFDRDKGSLLIDVNTPGLAADLLQPGKLKVYENYGFSPQSYLHITVVNPDFAKKITGKLSELYSEEIKLRKMLALEDYANSLGWEWEPTGAIEPFQGKKDKGVKLIARIHCEDFSNFHWAVNQMVPEIPIVEYPPHITLLKQPPSRRAETPHELGGLSLGQPLRTLSK
jgi:hypothetical protein